MKTEVFTIALLSLSVAIGINLSAQDNSHFKNKDKSSKSEWNIGVYPDGIQRYGHGFSEPNDFTPEEYEYIAKNYSIFTVEKRHAWGDYGPKPNTEAATI